MTSDSIAGRATLRGTATYRDRFQGRVALDHFRQSGELWLSSLGIGTYLGEPDERDDAAYGEAVVEAVRGGINVIDTAINYRFQRSERSVGRALRALMQEGFRREEIVVATKGGFIPFDGGYPSQPAAWFRTALLEPGIAAPHDVVADCHVMTPAYLEAQIAWSRRNLGVETIDVYYLHNPETQLQAIRRDEFLVRARAAFDLFERKVEEGVLGVYGVATWDGLRAPPDDPGHLSLRELLSVAERVGGPDHHFRAVQLPVNLVMGEACLSATQLHDGRRASVLDVARAAGLTVMASGSLLQGQIIGALPPSFAERVPEARTNAQRGLQVVRSVPGLACALVGMRRTAHVRENLELAVISRLAGEQAAGILESCRRR